jgi:hypothetical protein
MSDFLFSTYTPRELPTVQLLKEENKTLCEEASKHSAKLRAKCFPSGTFFSCQNVNGIPITVAFSSTWNNQPREFIRWVKKIGGNTPQKRCEEVTERLNFASGKGEMYLTFGIMDGQNVICTTDKLGDGCKYMLFPFNGTHIPQTLQIAHKYK